MRGREEGEEGRSELRREERMERRGEERRRDAQVEELEVERDGNGKV